MSIPDFTSKQIPSEYESPNLHLTLSYWHFSGGFQVSVSGSGFHLDVGYRSTICKLRIGVEERMFRLSYDIALAARGFGSQQIWQPVCPEDLFNTSQEEIGNINFVREQYCLCFGREDKTAIATTIERD